MKLILRFQVWVTERVTIPSTEVGKAGREAELGEDGKLEASIVVPPFLESFSIISHTSSPVSTGTQLRQQLRGMKSKRHVEAIITIQIPLSPAAAPAGSGAEHDNSDAQWE